MPLFRSTSDRVITFDAGDTRYVVPPGGICELDKRVSYVPRVRGLPLVAVDRKDVPADAAVIDGAPVLPPKRTRIRGVASGQTVLESDDADDRVGEPISEARASLAALAEGAALGGDDDGDGESAVVPAVVAKAVRARKGEG